MSNDQRYPPLKYGSVCSGIEAATAAWHPLGMEPVWFAEIEPFPSAVLAHHYPRTQNLGDMTKLAAMVLSGKIAAPDVLVGGTPCQAFSVAGMRQGMLDPRGALTIKYVELADAVDHVRASRNEPETVIVWENVPGVLSDKGNAFGCFLGALAGEDCELQPPGKRWQDAGCVYGPKRTIAWRILDAQYFGLAQRRRRVFVVASARAGFDPLEVLFEREGVRRDTAPRRGEGQDLAGRAPFGPALQCGCGNIYPDELGEYGCMNCEGEEGPAVSITAGVPAYGGHSLGGSVERSATLTAKETRLDMESETFFLAPSLRAQSQSSHRADCEAFVVSGTLQANGKAAGSATSQDAESGLLVVHGTQDPDVLDGLAHPLGRNSGQENAVLAVSLRGREGGGTAELGGDVSNCLRASTGGGDKPHVLVPKAFAENSRAEIRYEDGDGDISGALSGGGGKPGQGAPCIAYSTKLHNTSSNQAGKLYEEYTVSLDACSPPPALLQPSQVRRLTPVECERLQGFPDDYTLIPYRGKPASLCPDGPRYKAIGNSKAVPVVRWIGRRIKIQLEAA